MPRPKSAEMLKEQFSDVTRGHRRNLVVFSAIAIFVSLTGLFPSEISGMGIKIGLAEKQLMIWGFVIEYFIFSFRS